MSKNNNKTKNENNDFWSLVKLMLNFVFDKHHYLLLSLFVLFLILLIIVVGTNTSLMPYPFP